MILDQQQLLRLPGNLMNDPAVQAGIDTCIHFLTTEDSDDPLDINQVTTLRKQPVFASSHFVVDIDDYQRETVQAAKALAVTLARQTDSRGRVQVTILDPAGEDMELVRKMGFGLRTASWAYMWLTPGNTRFEV